MLHAGGIALVKDLWGIRIFSVEFQAKVRGKLFACMIAQEAWGTIENNAEIIQKKINEILEENHCGKVNIIAHSKGGLDARYLISGLHMEDKVASLTTISTPHRAGNHRKQKIKILFQMPRLRQVHKIRIYPFKTSR